MAVARSSQEAPSASWGIVGSIPGLAPGASKDFQQARAETMFRAEQNCYGGLFLRPTSVASG